MYTWTITAMHLDRVWLLMLLAINAFTLTGSIAGIGIGLGGRSEMGSFTILFGSQLIDWSAMLLIVVALLSFVLVSVGCFATITQRSALLLIYSTSAFLLSLLAAVIVFLVTVQLFQLNNEDNSTLLQWFEQGISEEYGHPNGEHITRAWDQLHQTYSCCGMNNDSLWTNSAWFRHQRFYPKQRIPISCCATCVDIHDRFCSSFFISNGDPSAQRICMAASELCSSASQVHADLDACLGRKVIKENWPRRAFIHDKGCFFSLREAMLIICKKMLICSLCLATLLLIGSAIALLGHRQSDPDRGAYTSYPLS